MAAPPASAPGPAPLAEPADRQDTAQRRLVLLAAAAVVLVLAAFVVPALGDDDNGGTEGTPTTEADGDAVPPDEATTAPDATETTPAPTTTSTTAPGGALPAGWTPFADPEGTYTIGLPPGWQVDRTGNANRIDLRDPATGSLMRIEWVSPPRCPVGAWQASAAGFARNVGYQEIGIQPVTYRDYDAALWEFRHGSRPGVRTGNLGFVTNGRGYALCCGRPRTSGRRASRSSSSSSRRSSRPEVPLVRCGGPSGRRTRRR